MLTALVIGAAIGIGVAGRHYWPWQRQVIIERPVYVERVVEKAPEDKK